MLDEGSRLRKYFIYTFAITWLVEIGALALTWTFPRFPAGTVAPLGGVGPVMAAVFLVSRDSRSAFRRDYWRRVIDMRRIGLAGWAVIVLAVPVVTILAVMMSARFNGTPLALPLESSLRGAPLRVITLAVFTLFFGPIPEELGWRGYAQPGMQQRFSPLAASALLGGVWALWHVPLFFVPGTYQYRLGAGSTAFWFYLLNLIPVAVVYGWLFATTQRSTLAAVLFHFMGNFVGELFALSEPAELWLSALWLVPAVLIAIFWKDGWQVELSQQQMAESLAR